jgi:hypothetical protein
MKITPELKVRIDAYFNSISPEDLVNRAVSVYGFEEIINVPTPFIFIELNNSMDLISDLDLRSFITEGQGELSSAA